MGVLQLGPGYCYVKSAAGLSIPVGVLEGGSFKLDIEQKYIGGAFQFDEWAGNTGAKIEGKVEFKSLDLPLLLALGLSQYSDGTSPHSDVPVSESNSFTISTNTYTVTDATAVLGVRDPITGKALKQVASAPAAGQYSVSGTSVTVAAADVTTWGTAKPFTTYLKAATSDANKINLLNAMMQESVYFGLTGFATFSGKAATYNFLRCVSKSLPIFEGKNDFAKREFDVKVLATPDLHTIGSLSYAESLT